MTIHLVRHGETAWNRERRLQGWTDIPLNDAGIFQARAAGKLLAGRRIAAVLSSDLSRARQTAELIAASVGVEVTIDQALRERNYGSAEGQLAVDLERRYQGRLADCWADPDFAFAGGESRRGAYVRLKSFLDRVLGAPPDGELVIVSHGGALRVARGYLAGVPVERLPRWDFANGEVVRVDVRSPWGGSDL